MIHYISTRDISETPARISSAEAIKKGLAPDGGLYMPEEIPALSMMEIAALTPLSYAERASYILTKFLTDYATEDLQADCQSAYAETRFPGGATRLNGIGNSLYALELWHGPTCAFKDMALQIMPRLLSRALQMTGEKNLAHILVATSGDTGKAALEGFRDVPGVKMTVFYPENGVSRMQKMQMQTQEGNNVSVCAVRGNFDDAQTGVKEIFHSRKYAEKAKENGFFFSSANSINWGRLVPQIVYYVSAYCDLLATHRIQLGDEINVCVPTGNFGNILAAFLAKQMGLPIHRFLCASNTNHVLTDFLKTGTYDRNRAFHETMSPSMDILISSNLERLLFFLGGAEFAAEKMKELNESGKYTVSADILHVLQSQFVGYWTSEEETVETIRRYYSDRHYLTDTHTAVAIHAAETYIRDTGDTRVTIIASTASPYKFSKDVASAIGVSFPSEDPADMLETLQKATSTEAPLPLKRVLTLPIRFTEVTDKETMADFVFHR